MASIGLRTAVAKNHGWLRMGLLLLVALAVFISGPRGHDCPPGQPAIKEGKQPVKQLQPLQEGSPCIPGRKDWLDHIDDKNVKVYSQNGEDGILLFIFANVGVTSRYFVEFGTQSCQECNTRVLRELFGWSGLLMDGTFKNPEINLTTEFITPGNINDLFAKHQVPEEFDLLSIDVDFDDYWVWKAVDMKYRPRVVTIEYNSAIPANQRRVIDPADKQHWTGTTYCSASLLALHDLGRLKGYTLVATDKHGINAFFVRTDILECQKVQPLPYEKLYHANFTLLYSTLETNENRKWLWLDEKGNVMKREFLPA